MKTSTAHFDKELVLMYHSKLIENESLKKENKELINLRENLEKQIHYLENEIKKLQESNLY
jgi:hypothetical protein